MNDSKYLAIGMIIIAVVTVIALTWVGIAKPQEVLDTNKPIKLQFKHPYPDDVALYTFNFYVLPEDTLVTWIEVAAWRFTLVNDTLKYTAPVSLSKSIPTGLGYATAIASDAAGNQSSPSDPSNTYTMKFASPIELIVTQ